MNSFDVSSLKENTFFTAEVVLDKTFLLLANSIPVTKSLIDALNDWEFKKVYSDGNIRTETANFDSVSTSTEKIPVENVIESKPQIQTIAKHVIEEPKPVTPKIEPVEIPSIAEDSAENSRLTVVQNLYNEYLSHISNIYTHYATHKELNIDDISNTVKDLCSFVREHRRYVLRIFVSSIYLISVNEIAK